MIFKDTKRLSLVDLDAKKGIVKSYWSGLGNRDHDGDNLQFGSYADTILERGPKGRDLIKVLWSHQFFQPPIGRPLELVEDKGGPGPQGGLLATSQISRTKMGDDVLVLYADGVLNQHSVGIDIVDRDEDDTSIVTKVNLWEGSPVVWGANPLTPTVDVKTVAAAPTMLAQVLEHLERIRKTLSSGDISDEMGFCLTGAVSVCELQIKQLQPLVDKAPAPDLQPDLAAAYGWLDEQFKSLANLMRTT